MMDFLQLSKNIQKTHDYFQQKAVAAVNQGLTVRNWVIGFYIVEFELNGSDRATYGRKLLKQLSTQLKTKNKQSLSYRTLKLCKQFYLAYPHLQKTITPLFRNFHIDEKKLTRIRQTLSAQFNEDDLLLPPEKLIKNLSFSHLVELMKIEDPLKRLFYEIQAINACWSLRELKRQMSSLLYERTGLSSNKQKVLELANTKTHKQLPEDTIKDTYIFEFLGLDQKEVISESDLEKALLDNLQQFMLELGKGFCFEARQKRIIVDDEYYYVDLVFYHRYLRCNILIDLKIRSFTHIDIGQMNFYLNYYKDKEMTDFDNPPIGIVLCADQKTATAKYALAGLDNQIFVSEYLVQLPNENELRKFILKLKDEFL
ncbi:MAG: YhcG family protein [Chitinophagales bacterium]